SQLNLYPGTRDGIFISYNAGNNGQTTQTFNSATVIAIVHQAMETAAITGTVSASAGVTPPAGGWIVYVDTNNDGVDDAGDPSATANSSGIFLLIDIPPGTWTVRIGNLPAGDTATSATLTVAAGVAYFETNFTVSAS